MATNTDPPDHAARLLRRAQQLLPAPHNRQRDNTDEPDVAPGFLQGTVEEFEEFIWHSEYELAWDTLVILGDRFQAGGAFWQVMDEAQRDMGLQDDEVDEMATFRLRFQESSAEEALQRCTKRG